MDLKCKPRLRRTMAAFGSGGWLVRMQPRSFELITRDFVGQGEKLTGVIRSNNAITSVRPAIKPRLALNCCNNPSFLHARFHPHLCGVPTSVRIKHFLARVRNLHGSASLD